MSKKLQALLGLLMVFSMILGACAPAEPVVEETQAPAVEETQAPVVEEPIVVAPDAQALFTALIAELPAEKGYGGVKATSLNEEMVDKAPFLLDVREAAEVEKDGYIEGAVNIPVREVLNNLDKLPGLDEPIVTYCGSGHRGGMMLAALKLLGYTNVRNIAGGIGAWKKASLPVVTGSMPEAPTAISTPIVADQPLYDMLNDFFTAMPDDFYSIKSDALAEALTGTTPPTIVDIRTAGEFAKDGYIKDAINVPMDEIFTSLDKLPAKDAPIVVHCVSGHRASIVLIGLRLAGYTNAVNLAGGLNAWKAAKLPVEGWVDWASVMGEFIAAAPATEGFYTVKADALNSMLVEKPPFLVDLREGSEIADTGYITGAINLPIRDLLKNLDKLPALDQKIVVYCASGHRGGLAVAALRLLGYTDVVNLAGGMNGWLKAGFVVEEEVPAMPLAGSMPDVNPTRLANLDTYLGSLPEGFGSIKPVDLNTEMAGGTIPFLLDLRTEEEKTSDGYIEGTTLVFINDLPLNLASLPTDKSAPIVTVCKSGHRGAMVMMYLNFLGYTNVRNLAGGMNAWMGAELPVSTAG
ncbi:MAG TPA: rhodanese-like domain-containing protein [Anaerolineales bacterium]|nr:rhodanese-like domain-containing protein [Anaerolineales bacterium]